MPLPVINETLTYNITIPSTKETYEFRPYYVREEKVLLIAYESKDQGEILNALKNTIVNCCTTPIAVDKLALFDMEHIFIQIRARSVGESADLNVTCQHENEDGSKCGEINKVEINLLDIKMEPLPDNNIKLSDHYTIVMRFPSYKDALEITTNMQEESAVNILFNIAARCIDNVKSNEERFDFSEYSLSEIEEWMNKLKPIQLEKMLGFIKQIPEMYYNLEYTCTKCKSFNSHTLRGITDFF